MNTQIHQTQQHYRTLVDVFSYPGKIAKNAEKPNNYSTFCDGVLMTAMTLLDNEVTFHTTFKSDGQEFSTLTGARMIDEAGKSDYLIIKEKDLEPSIFEKAAIGTLPSPEKSATLIIEVASFHEGHYYKLTGPGIKDQTMIQLSLEKKWINYRNEKCKEYPLGIDLILIDSHSNMMSIPRTTKIEVI